MSDISAVDSAQETLEKSKIEARRLSGLPIDPPIEKETPAGVKASRFYLKDEVSDRLSSARDAGEVKRDDTRVNILSNFKGRDQIDSFSVTLADSGPLTLDRLGDMATRVQIMSPDGRILADSEARAGTTAAQNYSLMRSGAYEAEAGTLLIRASRPSGTGREEVGYGLSFSMGSFSRDRDVIENNDPHGEDNPNQMEEVIPQAFGNVRAYEKQSRDVRDESSIFDSRSIGRLVENQSRLNVVTRLDKDDEIDHFAFDVYREGEVKLAMLQDYSDTLKIELVATDESVIADNQAETGTETRDAWENLIRGTLPLDSGQYVLRIARTEDAEADNDGAFEPVDYSLQLTQGTRYSRDYDTVESTYKSEKEESRAYAQEVLAAYQQSRQNSLNLLTNMMYSSVGLSEYDSALTLWGDPSVAVFDNLRQGAMDRTLNTLKRYGYA
jgi:hypothetical protein